MSTPGDPPMRAWIAATVSAGTCGSSLGEMHQERARTAAGLVEMLVDLDAVVADAASIGRRVLAR